MSVIEAEFAFLQVEIEHLGTQSFELGKPMLGEAPEGLDAVDVIPFPGELIFTMIDPEMLHVANIHEPVIANPAIGVDHAGNIHLAADDRLQTGLGAIRDDLGVDVVATFEHAEDSCLAPGTATAFTPDALGAEVGFVNFDNTFERRLRLADISHADAQEQHESVDGIAIQFDKLADRNGVEIERKMHDQLPELPLRNPGTQDVLVFWLLHWAQGTSRCPQLGMTLPFIAPSLTTVPYRSLTADNSTVFV